MIRIETHQDKQGSQVLASSYAFELKGQLIEKLQTSLELDKLLSIYANFVQEKLDIDGLSFATQSLVLAVLGHIDQKPEYSVSLYADNEYLGQLVYHKSTGFSAKDHATLNTYHQQLVFPLRNALTFAQVKQLSLRDHLTGVGNRIAMEHNLDKALAEVARQKSAYTLMLLDLDGFKAVNDFAGHLIGDQILQHFVSLVEQQLRSYDSIYRYGGDEFVILMQEQQTTLIQHIFQRITRVIQQDELFSQYQVGCSAGAVLLNQQTNYQQVLEQADQALYQAKNSGKGKICFYSTSVAR